MTCERTPGHQAYHLTEVLGFSQLQAAASMGRSVSAISGLKKRYLDALKREDRDLEILRLHDAGHSNSEISRDLKVSERHVWQFLAGAVADD